MQGSKLNVLDCVIIVVATLAVVIVVYRYYMQGDLDYESLIIMAVGICGYVQYRSPCGRSSARSGGGRQRKIIEDAECVSADAARSTDISITRKDVGLARIAKVVGSGILLATALAVWWWVQLTKPIAILEVLLVAYACSLLYSALRREPARKGLTLVQWGGIAVLVAVALYIGFTK